MNELLFYKFLVLSYENETFTFLADGILINHYLSF